MPGYRHVPINICVEKVYEHGHAMRTEVYIDKRIDKRIDTCISKCIALLEAWRCP